MSTGDDTTLVAAVLSNVANAIIIFGISCSVTMDALRHIRRQAGSFAIGLVSQVVVMPALAYASTRAFRLTGVHALGLITLGCAPGGTLSNMFAYLAGADLALSIALTATTNVFALGTLPLLLYLWVDLGGAAVGGVGVPYGTVFLSLCVVLVPATAGIALRAKRPEYARRGVSK